MEVEKWSNKIELVQRMCANGSTKEEFEIFLHLAKKYELDPLLKKIWMVKYGNRPAQIFCGRDGFLSIAHRSGQFDSMNTQTVRVDEPIQLKSIKRDWQYKSICTVYRRDSQRPFVSEVYESEYSTGENLWLGKPRVMLGKVAESTCLRKAFDVSGMCSPEEINDLTHSQEIEIESEPSIDFMIDKLKSSLGEELLKIALTKFHSAKEAYDFCENLKWAIGLIEPAIEKLKNKDENETF